MAAAAAERLAAAAEGLRAPELWREAALLARVVYKSRSQHRRTLYFRRLTQVKRELDLLQEAALADVLLDVIGRDSASHPLKRQKTAFSSPSREPPIDQHLATPLEPAMTQGAAEKLLRAACFVQKVGAEVLFQIDSAIKAAALYPLNSFGVDAGKLHIASLLAQSFFMAFALVTFALLARLSALLDQLSTNIMEALDLVITHASTSEGWLHIKKAKLLKLSMKGDSFISDVESLLDQGISTG
eukprot:SM000028S10190  [mRNA]  locus=s28:825168:826822:- [translate_table: standard]